MAEKEPAKEQQAPAPEAAADKDKKPKKSMATIGLFGGVMVLEGVLIFTAMKFFGAEPDPTAGMTETLQTTTAPFETSQEMEVAQLRVQNSNGARTMMYNARFAVRVHTEHAKTVTEFLKSRKDTIYDALSRVLRLAKEEQLQEPGLETLKRQIRFELSTLMNDDTLIEQVLIPEFTPVPTGF